MRIPAVTTLTLAAALLGVVPAVASETPQPTTLSVMGETPSEADLPDLIVAMLTLEDGTPVTGQPVSFYFEAQLIGTRNVPLGTAKTDSEGVARLAFTPRTSEYTIRASFAGNEAYESSEVDASVRYPQGRIQPIPIKHHIHSLLVPLRSMMPMAITITVVAFWVFVLGLVTLTVTRIRREAFGDGVSE